MQRRRIVLGSLLAVSLAAVDILLFVVAGGLLALSEFAPARRVRARAA